MLLRFLPCLPDQPNLATLANGLSLGWDYPIAYAVNIQETCLKMVIHLIISNTSGDITHKY